MDQFKQFSGSFPPQKRGSTTANFEDYDEYEKLPGGGSKMGSFVTPVQSHFDSEEMRGSMQNILSQNVGEYVVVEFLIGTERLMRKQGILYFVGTSYVTLFDDQVNNFIVCDIFSIKFVYFYMPGDRPRGNYNLLFNAPGQNMNNNR